MLLALSAISAAHALTAGVHFIPEQGKSAHIRFEDVSPGVLQSVEVPCGSAPTCRFDVTVTADGSAWRVAVRVSEVRGKRVTEIVSPTFAVEDGQAAEFFQGGEVPIGGSRALDLRGIHVIARVETPQ